MHSIRTPEPDIPSKSVEITSMTIVSYHLVKATPLRFFVEKNSGFREHQ